jgi:hypothetical protein
MLYWYFVGEHIIFSSSTRAPWWHIENIHLENKNKNQKQAKNKQEKTPKKHTHITTLGIYIFSLIGRTTF